MGRPRKSKADTAHISVAVSTELRNKIEIEADLQNQSLSEVIRPVLEQGFLTKTIRETMANLNYSANQSLDKSNNFLSRELSAKRARATSEAEQKQREAEQKLAAELSEFDAYRSYKQDLAEYDYKLAMAEIDLLWDRSLEKLLLQALVKCGVVDSETNTLVKSNMGRGQAKLHIEETISREYLAPAGILCLETDDGKYGVLAGAAELFFQILTKTRHANDIVNALSEIAALKTTKVTPEWQDCYLAKLTNILKTDNLTVADIWFSIGWSGYGPGLASCAGANLFEPDVDPYIIVKSLQDMQLEFRNSVLGTKV